MFKSRPTLITEKAWRVVCVVISKAKGVCRKSKGELNFLHLETRDHSFLKPPPLKCFPPS